MRPKISSLEAYPWTNVRILPLKSRAEIWAPSIQWDSAVGGVSLLSEDFMATARFPILPVLEHAKTILSRVPDPLADYHVVCVQHLLETTGSLIQAFIDLGCDPQKLHILGKVYSANDSVVERLKALRVRVHHSDMSFEWGRYSEQLLREARDMWGIVHNESSHGDRIIVLDDGGACVETIPETIISSRIIKAVEQTMSGITRYYDRQPPVPVIEVASSAAKTLLESPLIRQAVLERVAAIGVLNKQTIAGVVGVGNIGNAVMHSLIDGCQEVHVFDIDSETTRGLKGVLVSNSLTELVESVDVVWGCTGVDLFATDDSWRDIRGDKIFISCSSQDHEFRSILTTLNGGQEFDDHDRRSDVTIPLEHGSIRVLKGGFPVNFDGSPESVPGPDIQLTRALLLGGVLQSVHENGCPFMRIMLNPRTQVAIVRSWLKERSENRSLYDDEITRGFDSESWVVNHSGGHYSSQSQREEVMQPSALQAGYQHS